jgi:hypothetical protein
MGEKEDEEAVGALGMVGSSRGGKRRNDTVDFMPEGARYHAERRKEEGWGPTARAQGGRPTRGAAEEGAPMTGNGQARRSQAAVGRCEQRKKSGARGPSVWARSNEQ